MQDDRDSNILVAVLHSFWSSLCLTRVSPTPRMAAVIRFIMKYVLFNVFFAVYGIYLYSIENYIRLWSLIFIRVIIRQDIKVNVFKAA